MLGANQVPAQIEEIGYGSMSTQKSLGLVHRFESPHPSLSHSGRLVRLLGPIILTLFSTMDRLWHQLTMCNAIASQLIRHYLSGLSTMAAQ